MLPKASPVSGEFGRCFIDGLPVKNGESAYLKEKSEINLISERDEQVLGLQLVIQAPPKVLQAWGGVPMMKLEVEDPPKQVQGYMKCPNGHDLIRMSKETRAFHGCTVCGHRRAEYNCARCDYFICQHCVDKQYLKANESSPCCSTFCCCLKLLSVFSIVAVPIVLWHTNIIWPTSSSP